MSAGSVPIPIELLGRIRAWRAGLELDGTNTVAVIRKALAPLTETLRSKPASKWLIQQAARRWEEATDGPDRIAFLPARMTRRVWRITDVRATATTRQEETWTRGNEKGIAAIAITARIERREFEFDLRHAFALSDHALARRLQRQAGCSIAQALRDALDALPWALACLEHHEPERGNRPLIFVPTPTGHWRGFLGRVRALVPDDLDPLPMLRSWLPDEAIEDAEFLRALVVLRRSKPVALTDSEQAALRLALARLAR